MLYRENYFFLVWEPISSLTCFEVSEICFSKFFINSLKLPVTVFLKRDYYSFAYKMLIMLSASEFLD